MMRLFGRRRRAVGNTLFVIKPYRWEGLWVFDDPERGLVREPFVEGADAMIDRATRAIPDAEHGFLAVFSAAPFPGAAIELELVGERSGGADYRWSEAGMTGWLCGALFQYFEKAPPRLYVQVKPAPH